LLLKLQPSVELITPGIGLHKDFDFHLLQLADPENKVAWRYFVAESLADLGHTKGDVGVKAVDDVFEVNKHPLRGFRSQVTDAGVVVDSADVRLEHHIELADVTEFRFATIRASHFEEVLIVVERGGTLVICRVLDFLDFARVLFDPGFHQVIGPETILAIITLKQGVVKAADVPAGLPNLLVHQDGSVHAVHIVAVFDESLPPQVTDIALQLDPQRAVVPSAGEAAINLTALVNKTAAFAQTNDCF